MLFKHGIRGTSAAETGAALRPSLTPEVLTGLWWSYGSAGSNSAWDCCIEPSGLRAAGAQSWIRSMPEDGIHHQKIKDLHKMYSYICKTRPDGNCCYWVFGFSHSEVLLDISKELQWFKAVSAKSKKDLVSRGFVSSQLRVSTTIS